MLFTIAIPVHNASSTIRETVISCKRQDFYQEFEIIIVDNASTDSTAESIKDLIDDKCRLIEEKTFVTMWENHNRCLKYGKGEYVLFCHADDYLLPSALTVLDNKLRERNYPKHYILWGHSMFRDFESALLNTHWRKNEIIVGEKAYTIFLQGGLTPSGTCYARQAFLDTGGFADLQNRIAPSDCFTLMKLAFLGFSFEMMDEMIFIRRFASTLKKDVDKSEVRDAYAEGVDWLLDFIDDDNVTAILYPSYVKAPPSQLLYAFASYKKYRGFVRNSCLKFLLKKPSNLRNKILMSAFMKSLFPRASK